METNVVFDTHAYVKSMTEAGADPRLAEAIAQGQIAYLNATAATKTDIANIQRDIERLRAATQTDLANLESRLIKWFVGALFLSAGLVVAGVGLLVQVLLS